MLLEELAEAGGIEESVVTLIAALHSLGIASAVLTVQTPAADNQYARRLNAAGVPLTSLPRWLVRARDGMAGLSALAATLLIVAVWPLSLLALLALLIRRRSLPSAGRSLRGWVQARLPMQRLMHAAFAQAVGRWSQDQQLDLLHVHGYGGGASVPGVLPSAAATHLPLVYSEHGIPWPSLRNKRELHQPLALAQRLIAVSHAAARALRDLCAAAQPIDVIYHVVPDVPLPARTHPARPLIFGCAAMLRPPKGHRFWVDSIPAVLAQSPNSRFVLAGDGSERATLEAQVEALQLTAHVTFAGQVPNPQLRQLLADEWDVFVLPSVEEPLGIVIVEAMAAGLPIVATRAGGVLDLVQDEVTALLVPPGDSAALAAAQIRLAGDPALRQRLGAAARQAYLAGGFDQASIGRATLAIYTAAAQAYANQPHAAR